MTKDEALKLALEALECALSDDRPYIVQCKEAITAIEEALAQPEQECKSPEPEARRPDVHCPDQTCGFLGECRLGYKPEQEPVAYIRVSKTGHVMACAKTGDFYSLPHKTLLYTTPPQRKPLTDEEIEDIANSNLCIYSFARAIEAAHGIYAPTERKGEA